MSKNQSVVNTKPLNQAVVDRKPFNKVVVNPKPLMTSHSIFETEQLFQVIIRPGMPIGGLLLALTYTQGGTVMSPVTQ